ncbi:MAG: hypothetical protein WBW76_03315 [Candidatus Cybelea sp.]
MKVSGYAARAVGFATAIGILAACSSGSQSAFSPSGTGMTPQGVLGVSKSGALHDVGVSRQSHGQSWMTPDKHKKKKALLYISDYNNSVLDVYSYPALKMVGQVTGLSNPDGLCNDKKGNIWAANNTGSNLAEYKHGGTSPISTVTDSNNYPVSCSVDPVSGNLAASNIFTFSGGQGSVAVYAKAKGSPTLYQDADLHYVYFVGYDNKGNLFADGENASGIFKFAELAKGSSTLKTIALSGGTITFPGTIRWDGKNVAVGDQEYQGQATTAVDQTNGGGGQITGTTVLSGSVDVVGYAIDKTVLIGADAGLAEVELFKYPAGGPATKTITGFSAPYGAAVSK